MRINAGGLSELIIGRDNEIKTLKAYIELGQHCAVIGPRRYGKTTLVNHVIEYFKEEYLVVRVDIFNASSIQELCSIFINEVYKGYGVENFIKTAKEGVFDFISKFKLEIDDVTLGLNAFTEKDEHLLIQKAFELAETFAKKHNKKALVFFDEFGDMERFGMDVIKKMRSIFQTHKHTIYLFAGSQASTMNTIFLNKENAFFNFASIMKIGKLPNENIHSFLKSLEIRESVFCGDAISKIETIVNGHPLYLIKLVQEAYIASIIRGVNKEINVNDVDVAVSKILFDNQSFFETEWNKINSKKYRGLVLKEILGVKIKSDLGLSTSYKSQLMKELKDQTILDDNKMFIDSLFELWMKREFFDYKIY